MDKVEIRIKGCIDQHWSEWFNDFNIMYTNNDETILSGNIQDQAALYGLIARLRDLGLTLIEVRLTKASGTK